MLIAACMALLLCAEGASAHLRNGVVAVRRVPPSVVAASLQPLVESLRADGYRYESAQLKSFLEGGFGSGFVTTTAEETGYVVTCRHVVSPAESAIVEFERDGAEPLVYRACPIVAVDEELDLALIALPEDPRGAEQGIPLATAGAEEGSDVWSAGFPGLAGRPTWQLGKGTVTNNHARVPELADPDLTTMIRHSAEIDPGNSGGPLVAVDPTSPAGYRIVVFSARALNDTPIPSDQRAVLEHRCRDFVDAVGAGESAHRGVARRVSDAYAEREGGSALRAALAIAPSSTTA